MTTGDVNTTVTVLATAPSGPLTASDIQSLASGLKELAVWTDFDVDTSVREHDVVAQIASFPSGSLDEYRRRDVSALAHILAASGQRELDSWDQWSLVPVFGSPPKMFLSVAELAQASDITHFVVELFRDEMALGALIVVATSIVTTGVFVGKKIAEPSIKVLGEHFADKVEAWLAERGGHSTSIDAPTDGAAKSVAATGSDEQPVAPGSSAN